MAKAAASLDTYSGKRDFTATPEPKPKLRKARTKGLKFVVQKHDATRLHFDLRLELGGVLKSWAVTKGPSMKAGIRRLAVETEDHPMEYLDWEGVIPKGQYGGGTMIVWDQGTWTPEDDAAKDLKAGKLTFTLDGNRLKGRFTLVRLKADGKSKKNNWLLIKSKDDHALEEAQNEPVDTEMSSAKTGVSNDDLARSKDVRPDHKARAAKEKTADISTLAKLPGAKKAILPVFVEPSLATLAPQPPEGSQWLHEIKHDGYRIQARIDGGKVRLLTRKGLDWTKRFPTVAEAMKSLPVQAALIDGEIIAQDETGNSSFSGLQTDLKSGAVNRIVCYVFDLLYLNGVDLRGVALLERKRLLAEVVAQAPSSFALRYNEHVEIGGETILTQACKLGLEGIISKREDLPYRSGRGDHWIKSKCMLRQEFAVLGYVPSAAVKNAVGSLVLGYNENGAMVHAGRAGTGFSAKEAQGLDKRLKALAAPAPKFKKAPTAASRKGVTWVRPELVAEIEYRGWSADGLLRQAAYKGLREDKDVGEVVLEETQHSHPPKPAAKSQTATPTPVTFTHPERVLWEDAGVTKQQLGDFYTRIADWVLPHVTGRVLSLLRCPQGAGEKCFFAKHAWMGIDDSVQLVDAGTEKPMLAIRDLHGLLLLVQMNVLEIHVWGSRLDTIEQPDRMIFDLDPGDGVDWKAICAAAVELRDRLKSVGLTSFVKTTGGKGLHVVVPLEPKAGWDEVKAFSNAFAELMAADAPARYVANMAKKHRTGKIFIDYLRNGRGATAVAAYSTRARPGAPISVPVEWTELDKIPGSSHFTVLNLEKRLATLRRDPWADWQAIKQKLPT